LAIEEIAVAATVLSKNFASNVGFKSRREIPFEQIKPDYLICLGLLPLEFC
jgi:hypothetical protein